ncbi:hypothetical protein C4J81_13700 [Deltaproteobacteria bacterium Smac51]|nr:hypothetical protein C4J81_13700 [Deltaproteobacteria bacterium Smac51]
MMKHNKMFFFVLSFCLLTIYCAGHNAPALATESAFGRYIPGVFAGPASEIVPPAPGVYWQNSTFYYQASAGKSLQVPFGGILKSDLKINFFNFALSGIWVPDWNPANNVNVAIGVTIPLQSLRVKADVNRFSSTDHSEGLGDIAVTPAVGWHWGRHMMAANVSIYMPTGRYRAGDLANIGLNYWTFTPSLAYTYVNPEAHVDFSIAGGVDLNTRNKDTDYRSGAMAHVDAALLGTFDNGLGAGIFGSMLYQIADDKGQLADRLNGFRGRSFAVGPMLKYSGAGEHGVTANLNWAPEFSVKNRLKGDAFYLNISGRF